jgi:hypothetical protein
VRIYRLLAGPSVRHVRCGDGNAWNRWCITRSRPIRPIRANVANSHAVRGVDELCNLVRKQVARPAERRAGEQLLRVGQPANERLARELAALLDDWECPPDVAFRVTVKR